MFDIVRRHFGGRMAFASTRAEDRRISRTKRLLHGALSALLHEKPYDAIAVKEILGRADVGRSTFYAHYRDKDELLASGIRDLMGARPTKQANFASGERDVVWFSTPIFSHLEQHRRSAKDRMGDIGKAVVHRHLERAVTELVTEELDRVPNRATESVPPDLLARYVATAFIAALNWWVETDSALTAAEIDAHFRALVAPALRARVRPQVS
jgi:AcrR family transcriptional regulator